MSDISSLQYLHVESICYVASIGTNSITLVKNYLLQF